MRRRSGTSSCSPRIDPSSPSDPRHDSSVTEITRSMSRALHTPPGRTDTVHIARRVRSRGRHAEGGRTDGGEAGHAEAGSDVFGEDRSRGREEVPQADGPETHRQEIVEAPAGEVGGGPAAPGASEGPARLRRAGPSSFPASG